MMRLKTKRITKICPSQDEIRRMPGYSDAIEEHGEIRSQGQHDIHNAPQTISKLLKVGSTPSIVVHPPLPTDGVNYKSTSNLNLFNQDISIHDIQQGQVGDCYFLSPLAGMAFYHPEHPRQQIVKDGDLFRCRFRRSGHDTWVYVNDSLPDNAVRNAMGCNWVGLYEKAYAYFRSAKNTYASLNLGYAGNAFNDLGYGYIGMMPSQATDVAVATAISKGLMVCIMTFPNIPADIPLIGSHSETVIGFDQSFYYIYNPWGIDGSGNDGSDDGLVRIPTLKMRTPNVISMVVICTTYTPPDPFIQENTMPIVMDFIKPTGTMDTDVGALIVTGRAGIDAVPLLIHSDADYIIQSSEGSSDIRINLTNGSSSDGWISVIPPKDQKYVFTAIKGTDKKVSNIILRPSTIAGPKLVQTIQLYDNGTYKLV